MYGLACDQLVSLTMVNFKGEVLQASAKDNPYLFWASCGGGGGNFGIVTEFKLNTVPVPPKVTYFTFKVTKGAVDYLLHLQNTVSKVADPRIGGLQVNPESKNSVANEGLFLGTAAELDAALKSSQLSSWATNLKKKEMTWIDSVVQFAGSDMSLGFAYKQQNLVRWWLKILRSPFYLILFRRNSTVPTCSFLTSEKAMLIK